jgi:hypothetical protein
MAIERTQEETEVSYTSNSSLKLNTNSEKIVNPSLVMDIDPYSLFLNAIKSIETRKKCIRC